MIRFNKLLITKLIALVVIVTFSVTSTAYGIGLSEENCLRKPMAFEKNSSSDASRIKSSLPNSALKLQVTGGTYWIKDKSTRRRIVKLVREINQSIQNNYRILEMGVGSGILTRALALDATHNGRTGVKFFGTDIEPSAVEDSKWNLKDLSNVKILGPGNLFSPLDTDLSFHVIFWNPPWYQYRARHNNRAMVDPDYETLRRFLKSAPSHLTKNGKIYIIFPVRFSETLQKLAQDLSLAFRKISDGHGIGLYEFQPIRNNKIRWTTIEFSNDLIDLQNLGKPEIVFPAKNFGHMQVISKVSYTDIKLGTFYLSDILDDLALNAAEYQIDRNDTITIAIEEFKDTKILKFTIKQKSSKEEDRKSLTVNKKNFDLKGPQYLTDRGGRKGTSATHRHGWGLAKIGELMKRRPVCLIYKIDQRAPFSIETNFYISMENNIRKPTSINGYLKALRPKIVQALRGSKEGGLYVQAMEAFNADQGLYEKTMGMIDRHEYVEGETERDLLVYNVIGPELYRRVTEILNRELYRDDFMEYDTESISTLYFIFRDYFDSHPGVNPVNVDLTESALIGIIRDIFYPFFRRRGFRVLDFFSGASGSPVQLSEKELEKLGYKGGKLYTYGLDNRKSLKADLAKYDTGTIRWDVAALLRGDSPIPASCADVVTLFRPEHHFFEDGIKERLFSKVVNIMPSVKAAKKVLKPGGWVYIFPEASDLNYKNDHNLYEETLYKEGFTEIEKISDPAVGLYKDWQIRVSSRVYAGWLVRARKPFSLSDKEKQKLFKISQTLPTAGEVKVVRFVRPSREKYPGFKLGMGSDKHHVARIVEELIHEKITLAQGNGEIAIIRMPTGNTPLKDENGLPGVYDLLAERDDIDWSRVIIFMLDEYGGTSFDYHLYIYGNFIKRLKELNKKLPKVYCLVDPKSTWPIDKTEEYEKKIEEFRKKGVLSVSPDEYSKVFDSEIKKARLSGPYKAHVGFGGLGKAREAGSRKFKGVHIAFNEEGSFPHERTRRTELSPSTIYSNRDDPGIQSQIGLSVHEIEELGIEGIEKALEERRIPKAYANTTGMYELLEETETIIFAANGKNKMPSVDVVVFDEISPDNPASYTRGHNDSYLVIDSNAASEKLSGLFPEQDNLLSEKIIPLKNLGRNI